jgi:hypothetical protein
MRRSWLLPSVSVTTICLIALFTVTGCFYQPGGSMPEGPKPAAARAWTSADVDAAVVMTQETIYSPLSRANGEAPAEADNLRYLRFRPRSGGEPDAVLVIMPGIMCGAGVFNYLGREMVYMAQREGRGNLEVLAVEWRSNRAEDLTGLNAAEAAGDSNVAIDYYYNGAEIGGRTFAGFSVQNTANWLSEVGLEQGLRDVYTVITTNVPDPAQRRSKVYVGGHSLGGFFTAAFAGWDFDGNPATLDDAGYRNCAGLVGLDTVVMSTNAMLDPMLDMLPRDFHDGLANMADNVYTEYLKGLREGSFYRYLPVPIMDPEGFMMLELMALEAGLAPDKESTLLSRAPYSANVDNLFRVLQSRDMLRYLLPLPGIKDFRFTNEALLGGMIDDNFEPVSIVQASMGFMNGGFMQKKDFPLPSDLANIPGLQDLVGGWFAIGNLYTPWDAGPPDQLGTGPLYGWTNFDEITAGSDTSLTDVTGSITYNPQTEEMTDIADLARTFYQGPTNFFDWYYPTRLLMDMVAMDFDWSTGYGLSFLHGDHVTDLPKIEFIAENGPFTLMAGLYTSNYITCEGYSHIDVLTAAANRPDLRPNEVFSPLLDFMFK